MLLYLVSSLNNNFGELKCSANDILSLRRVNLDITSVFKWVIFCSTKCVKRNDPADFEATPGDAITRSSKIVLSTHNHEHFASGSYTPLYDAT